MFCPIVMMLMISIDGWMAKNKQLRAFTQMDMWTEAGRPDVYGLLSSIVCWLLMCESLKNESFLTCGVESDFAMYYLEFKQ